VFPEHLQRSNGRDNVVAGSGFDFNYPVPAHVVDYVRAPRGIAVGSWRGTSYVYMQFAQETLIDEVAALKGVDPVAFRLDLLKANPRARRIIETVARMAKWGESQPAGRALGIAYSSGSGGHHAVVADASVDKATGAIKVHRMWATIDAGFALQPKNIRAQIEGGMIYALGPALFESVDIKNGVVGPANFDGYRVPRMEDVPQIEVEVISNSSEKPAGVGEVGARIVAPAIANAVSVLTGKRFRHQLMSPARVLETLRG
jgi:isoquinoline 1-oxidoreductase beta subunit